MTPPDRFATATFDTYDATTSSQAEALHAARHFVEVARRSPSVVERVKRAVGLRNAPPAQGLYLVGPAGTGKTHLLAAAHTALTPEVPCAFLHSSTLFRRTDPPDDFARSVADRYEVCCLDEVEIDDPANEMRLVQFMKTLAARGVPLLATSNVTPEQYLSTQFSQGRFQRFLHREFSERYRIVFVEGEDYRRTQSVRRNGRGWIGPPNRTEPVLRRACRDATGSTRWYSFSDFREASRETAHPQLLDALTSVDHLFLSEVAIANTDDALRLLRVIDALYLHDDAPALHFTAAAPPDAWFDPDRHAGVAQAIAEKFERTVSRLHAMCAIRNVSEVDALPSEQDPS